jgi:hypothetical protein
MTERNRTGEAAYARSAARVLVRRARHAWIVVVAGHGVAALLSVASLALHGSDEPIALAVALMFVLSEFGEIWARSTREHAEEVKRRADLCDSFGWELSAEDHEDLVLADIVGGSYESGGGGAYHSSTLPCGAQRALENLIESAWWTSYLSQFCRRVASIVLVGVLVVLLLLLLATAKAVEVGSARESIAQVVVAAVVGMLSMGLLRGQDGFATLSRKSRALVSAAENILRRGWLDDVAALRLWGEYHALRAGSPAIPHVAWVLNRKKLRKAWAARQRLLA